VRWPESLELSASRLSLNVLIGGPLVAGLAAAFLWFGSPRSSNAIIDTWPIGPALDCTAEGERCNELIRVGLAGLDSRERGHAAIVSSELHREGTFVNLRGETILMTRSGSCCSVLVVTLSDGATHAIGVGYPGVSRTAIAIPWEQQP